jgi:hypothetical protein
LRYLAVLRGKVPGLGLLGDEIKYRC